MFTGGRGQTDAYVERYELQPIDPQPNGPQYYYGLRSTCTSPSPARWTFHDQVLAVGAGHRDRRADHGHPPRPGGSLSGPATRPTPTDFELTATLGDETSACPGPRSSPTRLPHGLGARARVGATRRHVDLDEDTVLQIPDRDEPFHHTDTHRLTKIADPTPNPLARAASRHT